MENRALTVPDGLDGTRVDAGLARLFGFSRSFAVDIIEKGDVVLDGTVVGKSDKLKAGALLSVSWQDPQPLEIVPVIVEDMKIVYDDDDVVVVDKPVGVAAHPAAAWDGPTVLGALKAMGYTMTTSGAAERKGIVHRLDVGTSGLMAVAKSEVAYTKLKQAFRDRKVDKIYHAVVQGHPDPLAGTIDAPIGRHPKSDWKFAVTREGKPAITHYTTLEAFPFASLLEITLETGRTHQIRAHMAAQRHPCVGDPLYGADPKLSEKLQLNRQWLHAARLGFVHPRTNEYVEFESPYPEDLQHALDVLRAL